MTERIQSLRNTLEQQKGKKSQIETNINTTKSQIESLEQDLIDHEEAREVMRQVALETQAKLQYHIGDVTSMAMEAVFDDPYMVQVEFVQRRNKTECDIHFVKEGEQMDPMSSSGGGPVNVASFALRVASWSMDETRTRNTIILDEPFKNVSVDLQERASLVVKEISQKLGVQFIIITHQPTLAAHADKVFETNIKRGVTTVS